MTGGNWRTEAISDCVRVVVGEGRKKIILARLAPKQLPEAETHDNARVMALAPRLLEALESIISAGLLPGYDHPLDLCGCGNCAMRRLIGKARGTK